MATSSFRHVNDVARPASIEEPLNSWFIHRAAHGLLPFAVRLGIAPNAISIAGTGFGVAAALAYRNQGEWQFALAGFAFMLGWHVLDGLDGMVARATGRTSDFGRFLDGVCDYSVFILVYVSLALAVSPGIGFGAAFGIAGLAGASHVVQAAYYEAQRQLYIRRLAGEFKPHAQPVAGGFLERGYNRMQAKLAPPSHVIDAALAADAGRSERYRVLLQPVLRASNILGATWRTLAILAACLAGVPILYWLWEIAVLNLALICIEAWRRRREAAV